MNHYKSWSYRFLSLIVFVMLSIFSLNYFVDPLGRDSDQRYSKFTNSDILKFFNLKIYGRYDTALLGTSRVMKIDPLYLQELKHEKIANLALSAAHIETLLPLAKIVKSRQKNFIYGFDCFSLNTSTLDSTRIKEIEYNYANLHPSYFFDKDLLSASFKTLRNQLMKRPYDYRLLRENELPAFHSDEKLQQLFQDMYRDYKLPDDARILQLAQLADEDDLFIIYPKYQHFYPLFQEYGIEEKYFHAIKLLVTHTKAKVYSFYGLNPLTHSEENFDNFGWHFKPKISKRMFNEIFNSSEHPLGFLLTAKNVDDELDRLHTQIKDHYEAGVPLSE